MENNKSIKEVKDIKKAVKKKKLIITKQAKEGFGVLRGSLSIVLGLLICVALIRISFGREPIYFSSLLEIISSAPTINFSFVIPTTWLGDWGFLNFLRDLISSSIQIINFLLYIVNGMVNALSFVFFFISGLFGLI